MNRVRRALGALSTPPLAAATSVVLLALLASASGLGNGFVYDDRPIILENARVHTLARWWEAFAQPYWPPNWGDTNYRPLTILSFAVQWALGGGSPLLYHAVSVALYVGVCLAVLRLARLVLPSSAAWIVAALFAVHPVHVEAVANVVGQSELMVALGSTLAVAAYVRMRDAGAARERLPPAVAAIALLYAMVSFSKESGFLLPGLFLAAELTVVRTRLGAQRRALRARARELWPVYSVCAGIGLVYLLLRRSVLGGFGDDPNVVISLLSHESRVLTMLGVVPDWARLLLWPARLAADYSPPGVRVMLGPAWEIVPGLAVLLGAAALGIAAWRAGRPVAAFGLLWLAVAIFPVSNLVIRSGVILAERTLFLPSVGALIAVGAAAAWAIDRLAELPRSRRRLAAVPLALVLAAGAAKSASRQRVWRDGETFLEQIVQDAPLSYRAHYMYGMWLIENGRREEGERRVRTAIRLFPYDGAPYTDLADRYRRAGICAPAIDLYRRAIALGAFRDRARLGLVACLLREGHLADAAEQSRIGAAERGPEAAQFRRLLAIADSAIAATSSLGPAGAPRR